MMSRLTRQVWMDRMKFSVAEEANIIILWHASNYFPHPSVKYQTVQSIQEKWPHLLSSAKKNSSADNTIIPSVTSLQHLQEDRIMHFTITLQHENTNKHSSKMATTTTQPDMQWTLHAVVMMTDGTQRPPIPLHCWGPHAISIPKLDLPDTFTLQHILITTNTANGAWEGHTTPASTIEVYKKPQETPNALLPVSTLSSLLEQRPPLPIWLSSIKILAISLSITNIQNVCSAVVEEWCPKCQTSYVLAPIENTPCCQNNSLQIPLHLRYRPFTMTISDVNGFQYPVTVGSLAAQHCWGNIPPSVVHCPPPSGLYYDPCTILFQLHSALLADTTQSYSVQLQTIMTTDSLCETPSIQLHNLAPNSLGTQTIDYI